MKGSSDHVLRCIACGEAFGALPEGYRCPSCGDLLEVVLRAAMAPEGFWTLRRGALGVWAFRRALPSVGREPVSLGEGGTPLLRVKNLPELSPLEHVYVKYEGQNPTGSFKDRGMTVAVSLALRYGARVLLCASTGNTAASLAAYAARAGRRALVLVPKGLVARGKLAQAQAYGALVVEVEGNFDTALGLVTRLASGGSGLFLLNSINPYRLEGQKTLAYELVLQLGRAPDYVVLPVGNGGNISALWKGFTELKAWRIITTLPRLVAVQAEGAAPIAHAFNRGLEGLEPVAAPHTLATAINIGRPALWKKALRALQESGGLALTVSDEEILAAKSRLASGEGLFVEAASAAPLAALYRLKHSLPRNALVVCVATGSGLKDRELVEERAPQPLSVKGEEALSSLLKKLF